MKKKKQHLDILISAWEDQKERGTLTEKGIEYISGLKEARRIIFGEKENKR